MVYHPPYAAVNSRWPMEAVPEEMGLEPVTAPHICNGLPQHVISAPSLAIFCSCFKTRLFRRCLSWLYCSPVVLKNWHHHCGHVNHFCYLLTVRTVKMHISYNDMKTHSVWMLNSKNISISFMEVRSTRLKPYWILGPNYWRSLSNYALLVDCLDVLFLTQ